MCLTKISMMIQYSRKHVDLLVRLFIYREFCLIFLKIYFKGYYSKIKWNLQSFIIYQLSHRGTAPPSTSPTGVVYLLQ
jgi:hypothetical protein